MSQVETELSRSRAAEFATAECINKPVSLLPLPTGRAPQLAPRIEGICRSISLHGMQLELFCEAMEHMSFVACMPAPDGRPSFAALEVKDFSPLGTQRWEATGVFAGVVHDILSAGVIAARFCTDRMQFVYEYAPELLMGLTRAGILRRTIEDIVQVCPKCQSLPSVRKGCRGCGSIQAKCDRLIHHFACAYVGQIAEYETSEGLVCPKCRTTRLVVGTDFEYLVGPYTCKYCRRTDSELEQVGQCIRCRFRFPMHQAVEQELNRYYANRMDPLDFLAS